MCRGCYVAAGSPTIVNDATKSAARLIAAVYEFSSVGGNAHIVLDDWNLDDESIRFCLDDALKQNYHSHAPAELAIERECLEAMLDLTEAERASALAIYDGYLEVP